MPILLLNGQLSEIGREATQTVRCVQLVKRQGLLVFFRYNCQQASKIVRYAAGCGGNLSGVQFENTGCIDQIQDRFCEKLI